MYKIFKYKFPMWPGVHSVNSFNSWLKVLNKVDIQGTDLTIWAVVPSEEDPTPITYKFRVAFTGETIEDMPGFTYDYVSTVKYHDLVYHVLMCVPTNAGEEHVERSEEDATSGSS